MIKILKKIINFIADIAVKWDLVVFWRYAKRKNARILLYHGITSREYTTGENYDGKHVYIENFEHQIKYLKEKYNIISLNDFITKENLPPNSVVITFDDGYENNFYNLYPIIEKYQIPVTIFIAPGVVNSIEKINWLSKLEYSLFYSDKEKLDIGFGDFKTYPLATAADKISACIDLKSNLKQLEFVTARVIVEKITERLEPDFKHCREDYRVMGWDEIKQMKSELIDFQSHTVDHPILISTTTGEVLKQLRDSKKMIESHMGSTVETICYPDGYYNDEIIDIAKQTGYIAAVTTQFGSANKESMHELKRIAVSNNTTFRMFVYNLLRS